MKSFTEFLTENKIDVHGDFLREGFEEARSEIIALFKTIKADRDGAETKEEKTEKTMAYVDEFKKLLEKCISASATDKKFFTQNQETQLRILLGLMGLSNERYTTYLSMSEATDEEKDEWEKNISLSAAGLSNDDEDDLKPSKEEEEEEEDEPESEPNEKDAGKEDEDGDEIDIKGELVKPKKVDDEDVEKFISSKSSIPDSKIVKKVIVIVDEQIGDEPDKGIIGETSVVEHSILSVDNIDDVNAIITNGKTFKTARDFKKKIDALKTVTKIDKSGSEVKEKHSIKVFLFDKTAAEREEDPWTIETK